MTTQLLIPSTLVTSAVFMQNTLFCQNFMLKIKIYTSIHMLEISISLKHHWHIPSLH